MKKYFYNTSLIFTFLIMTPLNRALVLHFNNNNTYKYLMTSASLKLSRIFKEEVGNINYINGRKTNVGRNFKQSTVLYL